MIISDLSEKWTRRGGVLVDKTRLVERLIMEEEEEVEENGNLEWFMLIRT
eukprot:CAMPEP_0171378116 /NCGR_PEP_ID=MMETSP0879-20121228/23123_1 /TAXON_ID=67004 /ORGANISM="Thalassiosira weissflogii, Strain CCMP1336" /LENGTH=49 /DNA_ID=CAMNT_0011888441 /DNA_START=382 /DNA_END=531 /DNA_ORIENTATION=+